ncbi:MAG: cyclic pyranopterin monophosphate synthase MoaC [Peptococcaceae bacterium]|nr:cyclic pyranopterin monophosphate synthase MoaC [Peptococcaceae bacterium]
MENNFTHFDESGNAIMVDVSSKEITSRVAVATGEILVNEEIMTAIKDKTMKKGDVLGVARVAGIMAVKQTSSLIPMCHTLLITKSAVDFELTENTIRVYCTVGCEGKTGVEMEALTGATVALLTIYDMCKAVSKEMVISDVHLVTKSGGKSGDFVFGGK